VQILFEHEVCSRTVFWGIYCPVSGIVIVCFDVASRAAETAPVMVH